MENRHEKVLLVQQPMQSTEGIIDFFAFCSVVKRSWKFIVGVTTVCVFIAVIVSLSVLPVIYKSGAVLRPQGSDRNMGALASLASSLPLPLDITGAGGDRSEEIMSFLQSRALKERLILKYNLLPRLFDEDWDEEKKEWACDAEDIPTVVFALQEKKLQGIYSVSKNKKSGLISLFWSDEDPRFAKQMLDNLIFELQTYLDTEYVSDAKREREFVEKRLASATKDLEFWERQLPSGGVTQSTISRELLASQAVYTELRKQLELAKITEAKEVVSFKVLDAPFVPEKKDKPRRTVICVLTCIVSCFFALLFVLLRHAIASARSNERAHA